jgi:hypothetical protein
MTVHELESGPARVEDEGDRWGLASREKRNKGRDGLVERYRKAGAEKRDRFDFDPFMIFLNHTTIKNHANEMKATLREP